MRNIDICGECELRKGSNCTAPGGVNVFVHANGIGCPVKKYGPQTYMQPAPVDTAAMWRELHSWTEPTPQKLAEWTARVPATECSCRENWGKILAMWPADFSSPDNFFQWTVRVHNLVNAKLGKPILSLAEARRIHGR